MNHTHLITRLMSVALIAVLCTLTVFSLWATLSTMQVAQSAHTAVDLSDQYQQARYAVGAQESLERKYRLEPGPQVRASHRAAGDTLVTALHLVAREGTPDDRLLVAQVLTAHQQYLRATAQMFAAVDRGDTAEVIAIDHQRVDPVFGLIEQRVQTAADTHRVEAIERLAALNSTESLVFTSTPIVFAVGLLLLGFFWSVLRRYRRKFDEVTQAELARLARAALRDNLTELGNHRAYQQDLEQALQQRLPLTLALINIDEMKMLNDAAGHLQGDHVLSTLATLLRSQCGSPYRLSGDTFALLLPHTALPEALTAMDDLRQQAQRHLFGATVSIGITASVSAQESGELLQEQADRALTEAKRRGRNSVVSFEAIRESVSIVPLSKVHALHRLLSERRVEVAFQPIWNLEQGTLLSFEALTRPAAEYGFSGPQEAFDIAEQIGRAHELDQLCLQAILARAGEVPPQALLFVNLTPQTLAHDLLTGPGLVQAVEAAGLTKERVVLEITERSVVHLEVVVREARKLRELGFRLALDDTGAGNAGLEMLSQVQVDFVKIDRALIANALSDSTARTVLQGISTMAGQMGSYVIVEGIENGEMLDLAHQVGTQGVQGYLLGRPSPSIPSASELQVLRPGAHEQLVHA